MIGKTVQLGRLQYVVNTDSREKHVSINFVEANWEGMVCNPKDINKDFMISDFMAIIENEFPDYKENDVHFYVHNCMGMDLTQKIKQPQKKL